METTCWKPTLRVKSNKIDRMERRDRQRAERGGHVCSETGSETGTGLVVGTVGGLGLSDSWSPY